MNQEHNENDASRELFENICNQKKQYADKIPDFYKLIVSLSAVLLSVLAALNKNQVIREPYVALLLQATMVALLLNVVLGITALYGRIKTHLDIVKNICQEVDNQKGSCLKARESLTNNPLLFQSKIFSWSNNLCFWCFLVSQILLAWYAIICVS